MKPGATSWKHVEVGELFVNICWIQWWKRGNHQSFSQFEDQHPVALGVLLVGTHLSNLECNNQSYSVFLSCHSCQVAVCVVFFCFTLVMKDGLNIKKFIGLYNHKYYQTKPKDDLNMVL